MRKIFSRSRGVVEKEGELRSSKLKRVKLICIWATQRSQELPCKHGKHRLPMKTSKVGYLSAVSAPQATEASHLHRISAES